MIMRINVVLPAPFGPMRPWMGWSPRTSSSTSTTTRPEKLFAAPSIRIRGRVTALVSTTSAATGSAITASATMEAPHQLVASHIAQHPERAEQQDHDQRQAERRLPQ